MLIGAIHSFFLLQRGVALQDLAYLQIVFSVSALLFEFPTGVYAVKLGNKASLLLSCLFTGLFYALVLFAPNMLLLSISEISYALGLAFSSGALESWWMSELSARTVGGTKILRLTYLKTELTSFGNIFMGLAGAAIATFAKDGFVSLYVASAIAMFALMLAFLAHPETSMARPDKKPLILSWRYLVNVLFHCFRTRFGLVFLAINCTIVAAVQLIYHFWQPYFSELAKGSPEFSSWFSSEPMLFGTVFASYAGLKYVVNRYIRTRLLHVLDSVFIGCISALLAAILIGLLPWLSRYQILIGIACFAIFHSCLAIISNATNAKFYETLESEHSAAILSGANLFSRIAGIISLSLIALTVSNVSLELMFSLLAIPFLFIFVVLLSWGKQAHA